MSSSQPNITIVGSANVDFIFQIDKLPALGETVVGGDFKQTYGGKGANQAVAAARLGGSVSFVGAVGTDDYGKQIKGNFIADGIDVRFLSFTPDRPTGAAGVMFDAIGNNYLAVASGANYTVSAASVDAAADVIEQSDAVLLQMEIPADANKRVIERANATNVPVILNFAPARLGEIEIDKRIDGLIVNETECAMLSGLPCGTAEQARVAAAELLSRVGRYVIVTLGKDGTIVADAVGIEHIPPFRVTAVDATAAGDVFCGCLAVELSRGQSLRAACRTANGAAALSVTKAGAQPSIPTRAQLDEFLSKATL